MGAAHSGERHLNSWRSWNTGSPEFDTLYKTGIVTPFSRFSTLEVEAGKAETNSCATLGIGEGTRRLTVVKLGI